MELLAPAGGEEQLLAAVRCGADAVYLGTAAFNARRKADNFDSDALKRAVAYCHGRGVRVHVTVNTLVRDGELAALTDTVREIGDSGADAVILQDAAVIRAFRTHLPDLPRHASTQMTVHNVEGARMAKDMGFKRIIPARELSLTEIRRICDAVDIEVECFVHGALCMAASGQCLLSAFLGERSGNRGLCAQPCRLDFRAGDRPYALSLKDSCLIPHVRELADAGVCSLKIEGRLRRPEYVAAAVTACRTALDGGEPDLTVLERAFSRSGFTDGYLTGRRNLSMFGVRTEADKASSDAVMSSLAGLYRRERSSVPVKMRLTVHEGEPVRLTVSDGVHSAEIQGGLPEPVRSAAPDPSENLGRTGGTPFRLAELETDCEPGFTTRLNPLRREALERLLECREEIVPYPFIGSYLPPLPREKSVSQPALRLRFEKREQLCDLSGVEAVYLPVREIDDEIIRRYGTRLIAELPRLVWPGEEAPLRERLSILQEKGLRAVCAGNPGTVRMGAELGLRVSGGFDLNILNTRALETWTELGLAETLLSPEIPVRDLAGLGGTIPRGVLVYGYLPLMMFRCCPMQGANGCGSCNGARRLKDRQGTEFTVLCSGRQYSSLLNAVPLYLGDKKLPGADFLTAYFTTETREECESITRMLQDRQIWNGSRTLGPGFRKML